MTRHVPGRELWRTYDEGLGCFVREISICPDTGIGVLFTYGDSDPDMAACIDHFVTIAPDIEEVRVVKWFSGTAVLDMCYRRIDGIWRAFVYSRKHRQAR